MAVITVTTSDYAGGKIVDVVRGDAEFHKPSTVTIMDMAADAVDFVPVEESEEEETEEPDAGLNPIDNPGNVSGI